MNDNGIEREAPRPPLSDLGLASTPKPPEPPAPATPVDAGEQMQLCSDLSLWRPDGLKVRAV